MTFKNLTNLRLLDISHNLLKDLMLQLPNSLELLSLANNKLIEIPFIKAPDNLRELELQNNRIEELGSLGLVLENLKVENRDFI